MAKYVVRYGSTRMVGVFFTRQESHRRGARVVARTPRGLELADVLCEATDHAVAQLTDPPGGQILREMLPEDHTEAERIELTRKEDFGICERQIAELALPMQLVDVERLFGGERVVVYYLSEDRVDFRTLVKALQGALKTRVEMRQIGVRDEAKLLADYGDCGKPVCCNTHLIDMPPVSMKMAKMQKATLDPTKISGRCGRLKCCLRYEYDTYEELQKTLPPIGSDVITTTGRARVLNHEILSQQLLIQTEDNRRLMIPATDVLTILHVGSGQIDRGRGDRDRSRGEKTREDSRSIETAPEGTAPPESGRDGTPRADDRRGDSNRDDRNRRPDGRSDRGRPDRMRPDRVPSDRGPSDRGPSERGPSERGPSDRGPSDRGTSERGTSDRGPSDRGPSERGPSERGPSERGTSERGRPGRGWSDRRPTERPAAGDRGQRRGAAERVPRPSAPVDPESESGNSADHHQASQEHAALEQASNKPSNNAPVQVSEAQAPHPSLTSDQAPADPATMNPTSPSVNSSLAGKIGQREMDESGGTEAAPPAGSS